MKGVDISHYQRGLTIKQIKDAGNDFAIIKLTEGAWLRDGAAFDFYREAYEIGFPVGCYCYSHATTVEDATNEAYFLIGVLNGFPMPCGIFLDIEEPKQLDLPKERLMPIISTWCNVLAQAGYIPGVYSSAGTLWSTISPDEIGENCFVWVAKWSQQPPDTPCDLWQNSDSGDIDGVTVDTDQVRSDRLMKIIAYFPGYQKKEEDEELVPDACPIDGPCAAADKTNVSGAFALLAEFLQTQEFQEAFLRYAEARS